jgi:hypothetical protein
LLLPQSIWQLRGSLNLYSTPHGPGLATQAWAGRRLQLLSEVPQGGRLAVQLQEDGYRGWIKADDLLGRAISSAAQPPLQLDCRSIETRLKVVIQFALLAAEQPNSYLWGGSIGPDFDCSGLIQRAFASTGIWIPRDAYQQERFCLPVGIGNGCLNLLQPGDLIFFGTAQRCTHVGLHLGAGRYLHSSGASHGRNGIGNDGLGPADQHPVACHYRRELRGAGRVQRCHDGSHLP